ncbi:hypothetical protein HNR23_004076 [Nocardiopsis mwathae]|uniref:DUF4241 domain-containing protein n=1 Tax=Nocardiopsis mwathae TaxID=1472723 RepID=A0A7W9YM04_9ACTN|nr:DUF4241 domain-containing protein [Nocardiopsis mwathae]MBB6174016.1 hypothetical protein [Nocardiopsis mwathae]
MRFRLDADTTLTTAVHDQGDLHLPTGRLIAADPTDLMFAEGFTPYVQTVPPGRYPLRLTVAHVNGNPDHVRVCAAVLAVQNAAVTDWEMALVPGQDLRDLRSAEPARDEAEEEDDGGFGFFGFGVDGGMGCLLDAELLEHFAGILDDQDDGTAGWEVLLCGDGPEILVHGTDTVTLEAPDGSPGLIAFASGWGDGAYPVWFGRGGDGKVAAVVVDFLVLHGAQRIDVE